MPHIISIINQKGGVGKSTTAQTIGAGLYKRGYKVLFIDLDAQQNLTFTLGLNESDKSMFDVLSKNTDINKNIVKTAQGHIIPANSELAGADALITTVGKEYRLKEALEKISDNYEYIIIDTPPALGILTVNALVASTGAIIPAQADIYSLQGISQLKDTMQAVKQYCNHALKILGIILTRFNNRTILSRDVAEIMQQTAIQMETILYKTTIRECIAIKESQIKQQNIFDYSPKSNASIDYNNLIDEILLQTSDKEDK